MENEIKNSEMYLNKKVGKETGFSTPANYFDDLEDVVLTKISEEKLPKETGFKVDESYFNNLDATILAKISSEEKEAKVIRLKDRFLKIIPFVAAASIVLFIGLNSFVFNTNDNLTLDSLSDNEIENWLDTSILNTSDIATILQDDIDDVNGFYFTNIKDESIEEYIINLDNNSLLDDIN